MRCSHPWKPSTATPARWTRRTRHAGRSCTPQTDCSWTRACPPGSGIRILLARYYGTGVYPVDFQDEDTTRPAIDAWVNKNTGGRIKKAPAEYSRDNTFSVLNAVYFASAWKVPFDPADTSDRPFTTADGRQVTVPTMSGVQELAFARGKGWQAVDLPYAEGFVMRLVLPDSGAPGSGVQYACRR